MDMFDQTKAREVWQRVQGNPPVSRPEEGLLALILREAEDADIYLQLSRRLSGKAGAMLGKMYQQEQAHLACLRGIYILTTGKRAAVSLPKRQPDAPERLLRRCYGQEMRCIAQYDQRSSDPEYGQVFAKLAEQEREHCRMILELLGGLLNG